MLAVRALGAGKGVHFEDVPIPQPVGTQVLLKVAGCGVCHTDVHITRSDRIRIGQSVTLGHEIGGWVDAVGELAGAPMRSAGIAVGDAVVVFGGWGCGRCADCLADAEHACEDRESPGLRRDGGFAEYVLVPHPRHLVALGPVLDPAVCAPLADAGLTPWHATLRAKPWLERSRRVVVIGAGGLGQFAIQYLGQFGAGELVVLEPDASRRDRARRLGADRAVDPAIAGREGLAGSADVVFDYVGSAETLHDAAELITRGGLISLIGEAGGRLSFGFRATRPEVFLTTNSWGSLTELRDVVDQARRGAVSWTVEQLPLSSAQHALDRLADGYVSGRLVLVP